MHAHWVEVFDRANDDTVVGPVTHDLHLEFLPAEQRLLYEHLGDRRQVEAVPDHLLELVAVIRDAAAGAAKRVGRPDDERELSDLIGDAHRLLECVRHAAGRHVEADPDHGILEKLTVLAALNCTGVGPDHLDAQALKHAAAVQRHRGVERRLPAERRQQNKLSLRAALLDCLPFTEDNFLHTLRRDRLDVGAIGELRVCHDRRRVGVHEHDAVALLLEGLARLRAGVVEFAGLPDDDRTGADD